MLEQVPIHPVVVHTPIALLVFSALFAVAGRLFDRDWVRRASVLLLVFGFLGAVAANLTGNAAESVAEERQGVPEAPLEEHEAAGRWAMFLSGGALAVVALASRLSGGARRAAGGLALVLQLVAAAAVGMAGYRGGVLVYEHAAGVKVGGEWVRHPGHGSGGTAAAPGAHAPGGESAAP